jgi:hypothetical protein
MFGQFLFGQYEMPVQSHRVFVGLHIVGKLRKAMLLQPLQ